MQHRSLCTLSIVLFLGVLCLAACQDGAPLDDASNPPVAIDETPSIGAMHNEFLERLYQGLEDPARAQLSRWESVVESVNFMADKYGIERLNEQQILEAVEQGEELARRSPIDAAHGFLRPEDHLWWDRYSSEARLSDARAVFDRHVGRFGAPEPGSDLANFIDIAIYSAEFWTAKRGAEELHFYDPASGTLRKGWRKVLRFAVGVGVDGLSGAAAATGAGAVGGAIVGGLASYGADCMLFGCG